jgi:hypothetical protein
MIRRLTVIAVLGCSFSSVNGFAFQPFALMGGPATATTCSGRHANRLQLPVVESPIASKLFGSKEDEIADLEEKLRKLKFDKEKAADTKFDVEDESIAKEIGAATAVTATTGNLMPEMLSESWKAVDEEEGGTSLFPILSALGLLAFFAVFSQIPVGQDDLKQYAGNIKETSSGIDLGDMNPVKSVKDLIYTTE